jgi:hypothetical protein
MRHPSGQHFSSWVHPLEVAGFERRGCRRSSGHDEIATATAIVIVRLGRVKHLCCRTHKGFGIRHSGKVGIVFVDAASIGVRRTFLQHVSCLLKIAGEAETVTSISRGLRLFLPRYVNLKSMS